MECPHCKIGFYDDNKTIYRVAKDGLKSYCVISRICPVCKEIIVQLHMEREQVETDQPVTVMGVIAGAILALNDPREWTRLIWPKGIARKPVPPEVPDEFAADYREACLVLADSPNASAALSRRCLQHILRNKLGVKAASLKPEIEAVIKNPDTPSYISESLDHLREFGTFGAHPDLDKNTGVIVPVELGEAEWCLEVLEMVFEFYFVRPAKEEAMQRTIDSKKSQAEPDVRVT